MTELTNVIDRWFLGKDGRKIFFEIDPGPPPILHFWEKGQDTSVKCKLEMVCLWVLHMDTENRLESIKFGG